MTGLGESRIGLAVLFEAGSKDITEYMAGLGFASPVPESQGRVKSAQIQRWVGLGVAPQAKDWQGAGVYRNTNDTAGLGAAFQG